MCNDFSRSDHSPLIESWFKWAPQPTFEASVNTWTLCSWGWRSAPLRTFCGFCHQSRSYGVWPGKELVQRLRKCPVLLEMPLKRSHVKAAFWDIFSVDASNPMRDIKCLAVRADWLVILRINVCSFATSPEWALQGLSLDGIRIPQKRILELESTPIWPDLSSNLEIRLGLPPLLCCEMTPSETEPWSANCPDIGVSLCPVIRPWVLPLLLSWWILEELGLARMEERWTDRSETCVQIAGIFGILGELEYGGRRLVGLLMSPIPLYSRMFLLILGSPSWIFLSSGIDLACLSLWLVSIFDVALGLETGDCKNQETLCFVLFLSHVCAGETWYRRLELGLFVDFCILIWSVDVWLVWAWGEKEARNHS